MANSSKIEWTEATWNPTTGCSKVSPGCKHCYAERMSKRLKAAGHPNYSQGFNLQSHEHMLEQPFAWKKPRRIFVNSMSDLFHHNVSISFLLKVFDVMTRADWHLFQILTKRGERLRELNDLLPWSENVWMGVSVETKKYVHRIDDLRSTTAKTKFLSLEPLLGSLGELNLDGIDWVIAGGESGPGARPVDAEWVREIRDQCVDKKVAFFFKQWGGVFKKRNGRELDGRTWDEFPVSHQTL